MAVITTQQCTDAGTDAITMTQAEATDSFSYSPTLFVYVQNDHASATTVTITDIVGIIADPVYGSVVKGVTALTVASGGRGMIGPFKSSAFKSTSNTLIITSSNFATGVKVAGIYF